MSKGGSKLVTGLISFLLGFIFAILVEIGAIFGVYWFVMNNDINTVMSAIGIDNEGDRYINTDKENGGVSNLKELLSGVKGLVFENGELAIVGKSFDDISNLIPATQMLLNTFYGIADDYIELDHEEFESNPLMNLAQVLSDSVMNIKTAALLEKLGVIGDGANLLVKSLVMGSECDYAAVEGSELRLPVMYDYYGYDEASGIYYNCKDNAGAFPANLRGREEALLTPSGDRFALYYVPCRVTESGIEEAEYLTDYYSVDKDGKTYNFQILKYGDDTDFIAVEYNNGNFVVNYDEVYAELNGDATDASDRFTGYSYYEPYARGYYDPEPYKPDEGVERWAIKTYSGKNYFRDNQNNLVQLDALTLYDIIADPFAPLDSILVSEVINDNNEEGKSEIGKIFGTTTLGALLRGDGIDEIIDDLEVCTFIDKITPDNKVMCYIAYKISDLADNGDNTYTAIYDKHGDNEREVTVYLDKEGKYIAEVGGVNGVKVREVAAIAKNFTDRMTVGDVLGLDGSESQLLSAIKDTPLSGLADRINGLTVGEIISSEELEKSSMLRQLKHTKVTELATAIDKLFIQRVYAEKVYGVSKDSDPVLAGENDYHADWLYYKKVDDIFVLVNTRDNPPEDDTAYDNALGHITEEEFKAGEYFTYGEAQGMWRIVLYNNKVEKAYTMNNFNNMVSSCADNVYKSTLYDLQKAEIIDKEKDLSKTFGGEELGKLTLEELINKVLELPST